MAVETRRAGRRVMVAGPEAIVRLQLQALLGGQAEVIACAPGRAERTMQTALAEGGLDAVVIDAAADRAATGTLLQLASRAGLRAVLLHDGAALPGQAGQLARPSDLSAEQPDGAFAQKLLAMVGAPPAAPAMPRRVRPGGPFRPKLIAIGSSTGGPEALGEVLHGLSTYRLSQPLVLTQHMPPTFTGMLAERITRGGMPAVEATDRMPLKPGRVHVAPGGRHLTFQRDREEILCALDDGPPENFCRPAVDPMLRSAVRLCRGDVLTVILTGMGSDGLLGCQEVVAAGGLVLAQDEPTSVVWGMPGAVARAGICHAVLPLGAIAEAVARLAMGAST